MRKYVYCKKMQFCNYLCFMTMASVNIRLYNTNSIYYSAYYFKYGNPSQ